MKNLVIAACGDESLHRQWMQGGDFDLFVVYYGNYGKRYNADCKYYDQFKGTKFLIVDQVLNKYPEIMDEYDAVMVPDDDLYLTGSDFNRFFKLFHEHKFQIAQPAILGWQGMIVSAPHPNYIVRYTNWVEIMTPCFTIDALKIVKPSFTENRTNWGIDFLWFLMMGEKEDVIGVVDDVVAIHTRPCFYGDAYWRNNNNAEIALKEINSVICQYQIDMEKTRTFTGVERKNKEYMDRGSEDKFFPNGCTVLHGMISDLRNKTLRKFL